MSSAYSCYEFKNKDEEMDNVDCLEYLVYLGM